MLFGLACTAQGCYTTPHLMVITAATAFLRCIFPHPSFLCTLLHVFLFYNQGLEHLLALGKGVRKPKRDISIMILFFVRQRALKRKRKTEKGSPLRVTSAAHRHGWCFACNGEERCFAEAASLTTRWRFITLWDRWWFVIDGMEYLRLMTDEMRKCHFLLRCDVLCLCVLSGWKGTCII